MQELLSFARRHRLAALIASGSLLLAAAAPVGAHRSITAVGSFATTPGLVDGWEAGETDHPASDVAEVEDSNQLDDDAADVEGADQDASESNGDSNDQGVEATDGDSNDAEDANDDDSASEGADESDGGSDDSEDVGAHDSHDGPDHEDEATDGSSGGPQG